MTVNTKKITSGPYVGNGIADTFSYTFKVDDQDELSVYETDDQGFQILLVVDTDYTVNNVGTDGGGTIVRIAGALPTDYEWYIRSNYEETQLTAFSSQGPFFPDLHENAMDKLTFLIQQILDTSGRSPRLSDSYSGPLPLSLDNPVAGLSLRWNSGEDGLENYDPSTVSNEEIANDKVVIKYDSLLSAITDTSLKINQSCNLKEHTTGSGGGGMWDVVASGTFAVSAFAVNHLTLPLQLVLRISPVMYASQFGIVFDGTDESAIFSDILDFQIATGVIIDGENKFVRVANTHNLSPSFTFAMENWKIITGNDYTDQCNISLDTDVEVRLDNIEVDGERNTRTVGTEPWSVFSSFGGVDSIQPLGTGRFFRTLVYGENDIHLDSLKFTNYHGAECVKINSYATVFINNFKARNCSNKTYHVWHAADSGSDPDTGMTIANGIDTRDCGIMSASFLVDGVPKVRADNYAPQGAFGCIVTFGRYEINNTYVLNYGATGVTGDRNLHFTHSNTQILHTDANAFNNNPSGAFWNESCSREVGSNLDIKVTARDAREATTDSCLLQTFLLNGEISRITGLILETEAGSQIAKVIRGSHGAGAAQTITGYSVEATGSDTAIKIANVSGQSNKVALHDGRVRGGDVEINDSLDTTVTDLDSTGQLTIKPVINTPIGNVTLDNVVASGGNLILEGVSGEIKINGGNFAAIRMASQFSSSFTKMTVDGGCNLSQFNSIITGGKEVSFGHVETVRRVEFKDVETAVVAGGTYRTNIAEPILWFNPTAPGIMIRASVMGNAIWIQTGTVGAGYTTFEANVGSNFDNGNDKANVAYT